MDAAGAEELRKRLEQQEHWRQAEAVRDGRQEPCDPDLLELEELGDGVRYYGLDTQFVSDNGRSHFVTFRIVKRLVDGEWRRSLVREDVPPE